MKNTVIIKSFQNGISVYLNEDIPFPELLEEVIFKFRESRNFFKNAKMAISLEGRSLSDEEERIILNAICDNSDLHIVCLVGKDEEKNQNYLKAIQQLESHFAVIFSMFQSAFLSYIHSALQFCTVLRHRSLMSSAQHTLLFLVSFEINPNPAEQGLILFESPVRTHNALLSQCIYESTAVPSHNAYTGRTLHLSQSYIFFV